MPWSRRGGAGTLAARVAALTAFIVRRLVWTVPVTVLVITLIFIATRAIGGNPFRHGPLVGLSNVGWVKYGDPKPEAIQSNLERRYGLDLPWYEQYGNYLLGVATLDLGPSIHYRDRSVEDIIRRQAPRSLELGLLAFLWAAAVGIPAGVLAAMKMNSPLDGAIRFLASVGFALPSFLVATLLIYYLSVRLGWLPTSGWTDSWKQRILPSFALGLLPMAYLARLVRGSMLEALQDDYVLAARARGLRALRVVFVHALRNSLVPAVTAAGPILGYMMTSSFVIEYIFEIPGIGRWYIASVLARDYPVVMGLTVLLAVTMIVLNLLVDIVHALLDPRVRTAHA